MKFNLTIEVEVNEMRFLEALENDDDVQRVYANPIFGKN